MPSDGCTLFSPMVCADFEAELVEMDGGSDHVHLLVHYPPKVAVSRLVNSLRGVSRHSSHGFARLPAGGPAGSGSAGDQNRIVPRPVIP